MDLLAESFSVESSLDLTPNETLELCHNMGIAIFQQVDTFNTTIVNKTEIDPHSGQVSTYLIEQSIPTFLKKVSPKQFEHEVVKVVLKDNIRTLTETEFYNIGHISKARDVDTAAIFFQKSLLIQLKDNQLFYDIQVESTKHFKLDYQKRIDNKTITSLANMCEYINKYTQRQCLKAYNAQIIKRYSENFEAYLKNLAKNDDDFEAKRNNLKELDVDNARMNYQSRVNADVLTMLSPVTGQPIRVNPNALKIAIYQLATDMDLNSNDIESLFNDSQFAETMWDFVKKQQPMYYDLKDLF